MSKKSKILFGTLAVSAIAVITPLSVVSCSANVPGNPAPVPQVQAELNGNPVNNNIQEISANAKWTLNAVNIPKEITVTWSYNDSVTSSTSPNWKNIPSISKSIQYGTEKIDISIHDNTLVVTTPASGTIPQFKATYKNPKNGNIENLMVNSSALKIVSNPTLVVTNGSSNVTTSIVSSTTSSTTLTYTLSDSNFSSLTKDATITFYYNIGTSNQADTWVPINGSKNTVQKITQNGLSINFVVNGNILTITIPKDAKGVIPSIRAEVTANKSAKNTSALSQYAIVNAINVSNSTSK